jgi:DNA polymerase-3 subunit alpha
LTWRELYCIAIFAIGRNTLLASTPDNVTSSKEIFLPPDFTRIIYSDYPQIVRNTEQILDECSVEMDFSTVKNKRNFTGSRYVDRLLLEKLALDGMLYRYGEFQ